MCYLPYYLEPLVNKREAQMSKIKLSFITNIV